MAGKNYRILPENLGDPIPFNRLLCEKIDQPILQYQNDKQVNATCIQALLQQEQSMNEIYESLGVSWERFEVVRDKKIESLKTPTQNFGFLQAKFGGCK